MPRVKPPTPGSPGLSRRDALKTVGVGGAGLVLPGLAPAWRARAATPDPAPEAMPRTSVRFRIAEKPLAITDVPTRAVLVNDQLPGPELRVRENDLLRVTVENTLQEDTTVHWHGLLVPNYMDGVPGVTQMPIPAGQSAVYEYPIRQSGTYWYHSHVGFQEQQGLHGPLIIEAADEPGRYDRELVIFLSDWLASNPDAVIPELRKPAAERPPEEDPKGAPHPLPDGKKFNVDVVQDAYLLNGSTADAPWVGEVKPGERVRLRIINGSTSSFFRFQVEGHALEITHADGQPVVPVEVDDVTLGTAERYDAVVTIRDAGAFRIRAAALGKPGVATGVLRTPGAGAPASTGLRWGKRQLRYDLLRSPHPTTLPDGPAEVLRLELGGDMKAYRWSINGQYYPTRYVPDGKADPLLVREGDRVQVELVNRTMMFHPMHLHGHFFRLLTREGVDANAPLKDTLAIAPNETLRFEFAADNPGHWFFHCHNLFHLETGMARVFQYLAQKA